MAGARIQLKRAAAATWSTNNPVLYAGELGIETDTNKFKIGDGSTAYNSLPYFNGNLSGSSLNDLADVTIVSATNGDFLRWNGTAWINDAVNLSTDTIGEYVQSLVAGTGVTLTNNSGEGSTPTVAIGQNVGTSSSVTFAHVSAPVTGNVLGNASTATTLQNARTIELSGDVTGSVSFNGSSDVNIVTTVVNDGVELGVNTTGNYMVGVAGGTGVSISHTPGEGSTASVSIGQDVATTASVSFAHVSADVTGDVLGDLTGNADTASALETARTIELSGDVTGSVSFDGSSNVNIVATVVSDGVELGVNTTGNYVNDVVSGVGVTVTHTPGEGSSASIAIGQDVATTASVTFIHVSADVTGDLTGNADTATTLQTARAISLAGDLSGSVSFDGSQNVTITAQVEPNSIALGTDTTGNYVSDVTGGTGVTVTHTPGEGSSPTIAIGQAVATSSSVTFAHVSAPVTGNVTGDVSGNAGTATALQNARAISLGGDLSGSASFNGTSDITITAQVQPNSVALGTDTTGNYVNDVVAGTGISVTHTPGEGSSASVALNAWLNDLGDVVIVGSPERFQTLGYDGAGWVNSYAPVVSYVRNAEATTLTVGTVVYLFGGTGDHASVKRASNASDTTSSKTVGIVGTEIAAGQNGPVITRGYASGMNLSAYSEGDVLWLGTNGQFTTTKPSAPDHLVFVGVVVRATNNGIIYVAAQNGYELEELHDVKVSSLTNGDFLKYVSASGVWVNDQINLGTDTVGDYVQNLVAGTGVTLSNNSGEGSTPTVAIGQNVGTSASVTFARVETTGHLVVGQNLYVSGSVVTENQVSLQVDDPFIYLNGSASAAGIDIGIAGNINEGSSTHSGVFRDATDGKWKFFDSYTPEPSSPINTGHASYSPAPVVAETFESTIATGSAPFVVASTTEVANLHADTATTLHTARAISLGGDLSGSASFDGSGDITITASVEPNSVALGTDTTGNYMVGLAEGTGVTITHTPGEGSTASVAIGQDVATTASVTFAHVSASVTGSLSGNASTASSLQTARTISLGGDLSGSASFNGSSDITITASVEPNSVSIDELSDVVASSPTDGHFLKYVSASAAWVPAAIPTINNLDDVGDVTITSASVGHFLKWNGSAWINAFPNAPTTVSETAPASPTQGDIWLDSTTLDVFVRYDGAWLQINSEQSIQDLNDLADVDVQAAEPDQFLKYDGTEWIAASPILPTELVTKTSSYALTIADSNKLVQMSVSSPNNLTVPTNSSQPMDVGTRIEIVQYGTGKTHVVGDAGVTIRAYAGQYLAGQYAHATLVKRSANEWFLFGDLSAS